MAEQSVENAPSEALTFDLGSTVEVGDTALFVAQAGRMDGPPVVLLHGGLGSRNDFLPLAQHLSADCRLVAIDSRGHGRSALGIMPLTYAQLERDVGMVLAALDLREAVIIGHSDGAIVALRLASSGKFHLRGVIAVGAHGELPSHDPTREIYEGVTEEEWRGMFAEQVERYEGENPTPDFSRLFEATRAMWLGSDENAYPGASVSRIRCPLLVVHGDDDFLVSRRHAFDLAEQVEGARVLNLPFASHTVLEDDPEAVLPAVRAFLAGADSAERP